MQTIWNVGGSFKTNNQKNKCVKILQREKNVFTLSSSLSSCLQRLTRHWSLSDTFTACPPRRRKGKCDQTCCRRFRFMSSIIGIFDSDWKDWLYFFLFLHDAKPSWNSHLNSKLRKRLEKNQEIKRKRKLLHWQVIMTIRGATASFHTSKFLQVTLKWCHVCCFCLNQDKDYSVTLNNGNAVCDHVKHLGWVKQNTPHVGLCF